MNGTYENIDCMELMARYPDNHFDLAIVDPEFGIGIAKSARLVTDKGLKPKNWDDKPINPKYFSELFRVSKNQIIWGGNYMTEFLKAKPCWIVWDKNNGDSLFADAELAWTSFDTPIRISKVHWCGSAAIHETGKNKIHPTQKPIKLYDWIYQKYTKPGQRILDTHLGSGSNRIAAHKNGLHFVGFEIDEEYYYSQEGRFKSYLSQPTLFDLPRAVGVLNSNAPTLNFEQSTEL